MSAKKRGPLLPTDAAARKAVPIASGVLDYFPAALAEVARISKAGNDQHNPGQPMHWARGKSMDQDDTIIRHFLERGTIDEVDGLRHSAKLAWRALALLQLELEAEGAPVARGAREADAGENEDPMFRVREVLFENGLGPHPSMGEAALRFPDVFAVTPFKPYDTNAQVRKEWVDEAGNPNCMLIDWKDIIKPGLNDEE